MQAPFSPVVSSQSYNASSTFVGKASPSNFAATPESVVYRFAPRHQTHYDCASPFLTSDFVEIRYLDDLARLMATKSRQCDAPYQPSDGLMGQLVFTFISSLNRSPEEQKTGLGWSDNCKFLLSGLSQFCGSSFQLEQFLSIVAQNISDNLSKNECRLSLAAVLNGIYGMRNLEPSFCVGEVLIALNEQLCGNTDPVISPGNAQAYLAMAILSLTSCLDSYSIEAKDLMQSLFTKFGCKIDIDTLATKEGRDAAIAFLVGNRWSVSQDRREFSLDQMPPHLVEYVVGKIVENLHREKAHVQSVTIAFGSARGAAEKFLNANAQQLDQDWKMQFHETGVVFSRDRSKSPWSVNRSSAGPLNGVVNRHLNFHQFPNFDPHAVQRAQQMRKNVEQQHSGGGVASASLPANAERVTGCPNDQHIGSTQSVHRTN